ncbi:MAG: Cof-type HAD-IIB family hydrolase [Bacteroidales bacterium]|nr:Cof-type HAD-IIB family hydrolase [Bacteroidales bacterium]
MQSTNDKKAIFFDIDGTLWRRGTPVPQSTVRAIEQLKQNGHYVFINTGRSKAHVIDKQLLDIGWDGMVSACGTLVEFGDRVIYRSLIPGEEWRRIIKTCKHYGVRMIIEGEEFLYFDDEDYMGDPYGQTLIHELGLKRRRLLDEKSGWKAGKFAVDLNPTEDSSGWFEELGDRYRFIKHAEHVYEVVPHGCDKADGMRMMAEYLGIPTENVVAFGDGLNDMDMLKSSGTGVAMGNARQELKDIADYVTTAVEKDGIYNALMQLGLIAAQ